MTGAGTYPGPMGVVFNETQDHRRCERQGVHPRQQDHRGGAWHRRRRRRAALELDNGKWFDATYEQIAAELGISESRVARSVKTLSELGFVDVVRSDIPCRTYYSVNPGEVIAFITDAVEEPRVGGDE